MCQHNYNNSLIFGKLQFCKYKKKCMSLKLTKNKDIQSNSDIMKGLNDEQIEAVKSINGPLLIIAGAGSGKTKVLTHRIAFFLENGINPSSILALTFTNKAAKEMKNRIAKIVDSQSAERIWAGTFHSVFAKLLRFEAPNLGYNSSFSIYDSDDSLSLVKKIMNRMGVASTELQPQAVRSRISKAKNNMMEWRQYFDRPKNYVDKKFAEIYRDYDAALVENNAMDFDDLLLNMVKLFDKFPEVLAKYQNRFKYLMVDEYQDTNKVQYIIIKQLAKSHQNIAVVGDDAQSIYRWRGADIRNILDFKKDYPYAKVVRLEQNYRSTKVILQAADSVIKNNVNQLKKTLWTNNQEGEKIELLDCFDDRDEALKVLTIIKSKLGKELTLKDFAVLYRTNAQSLAFENMCRSMQVPYIIVGGMSFYKRKEIKDAASYLKLLLNPNDSEALMRIVNEPPRGLGQTSLGHITKFAFEQKMPLLNAFISSENVPGLQKRAISAAKHFAALIQKHIVLKDTVEPYELVAAYLEATGLPAMYKQIGTDEAADKLNNLQQFANDVAAFFKANPEASLDDYLSQMALASEIDDKDLSQNRLTLMTLHSAKGLEFPEVFIAGVEKGLFPLGNTEFNPDEEEEERRLFYVGITRAEQKLYLSFGRRRMRFGEITIQTPSPFLSEIDSNLIMGAELGEKKNSVKHNSSSEVQAKSQFSSSSKRSDDIVFDDIPQNESYSQVAKPKVVFKVGDTVGHSQFGVGRIVGLSGNADNRKAEVMFNKIGKKSLMLQYAKLDLVAR